ncbi:sugar-binding transcriptional regulator [Oceanobacillus jeddahense]|uniref:Sugar-binding transcriptional regulator n=1 Tax=Oceanobacillus jeddahense TaxID=1462527 RepID=A0ABY5JS60_9BACI|nr:sugar-binding transcriptional regulator [Oceanobacillus jeddahense]UUI02018.1 sugar-binding transcriptional regulator [Oceanobacillus jeddahense]
MSNENLSQLMRVAKKYYLLDMKQDEIAASEQISKSTVSRLINKARELGYVTFNLNFPSVTDENLQNELQEIFQLKHIFVAESDKTDERITFSNVSDGLSSYLNEIISDGDIVGVSWGKTMTYMSENLVPAVKKDVKFVLLNGGVSNRNVSTLSDQMLIKFAKNYGATWYFLQVPSFVDNSHIAGIIKQDSKINEIFRLIEETDTVIYSVGFVNKDSVLVKAGYFTEGDYENLRKQGFVGDICSRYIKNNGEHAEGELYDRVIGISLEEIKEKKNSICVAIGKEKAEAILASLKGGYTNTLFTDEITAKEVLNLYRKEGV